MNLHDFEKSIAPGILKKGVEYYEDGHVLDIEEVKERTYAAE